MQALDAPIYEVKPDSQWYKSQKKRRSDIDEFFKKVKEQFNLGEGFGFYHSEYFGVHYGTPEYEQYKSEVVKNGDKGFHAFKKRSTYYKPIKELLEQIEKVSPFKAHDTFGLNNVSASQWINGRFFYGVKNEQLIKVHDEVTPVDYKDYLQVVMDNIK